ncbi:HNH endonuclease, partial [Patescibacteria group bacterium]|nr:HNH endonuclease [Patescibacteria group bacterium]
KLKDKIKKEVDIIIKERDDYTCQYCGKRVSGFDCHVSHVVPVSKTKLLEFDFQNLKILCFRHHIHWWHKNPLEAGKWFREKFPDRAKYLEGRLLEKPRPIKMYELRDLYEEVKNYKPTLTVSNTKPESGRIVKGPTPREVKISKEEKVDYSLEARLKKHEEREKMPS